MYIYFFIGILILLIGIAETGIKIKDLKKRVKTVLFVFSLRIGGSAIIAIASFIYNMGKNLGIAFGLITFINLCFGIAFYRKAKAYEDNHPL